MKRREKSIEDSISITLNDVGVGVFVSIEDLNSSTVVIDQYNWPLVRAAIDELMLIAKEQNRRMESDTDD